MATYTIKFTCKYVGVEGYEEIEATEPPDDFELYELAVDHFELEAEIIEVIDDDDDEVVVDEPNHHDGGSLFV